MSSLNLLRHPELVSGSISPRSRSKRWQADAHRKVSPLWVHVIDQIDLPRSVPALELLFAGNGRDHITEHFEMDQAVDGILGSEPRKRAVSVLPHPAKQARGHADIQRAVMPARKHVDGGVAFMPRGTGFGARWTLKQVQGDELGLMGGVR